MNLSSDLTKIKLSAWIGPFLYLPWYWIMPILYPGTWNPFLPRFLICVVMWITGIFIWKYPEKRSTSNLLFDAIFYLIVIHHFVMAYFNQDEIIYRYTFFLVTVMTGALVHSFGSFLLLVAMAMSFKMILVLNHTEDIKFEVFEFGLWSLQFIIIGIIVRANFKSREEIQLLSAKAAEDSKMVALGTMAGGVAHEVNNPLSIIRFTVELLKLKANKKEQDSLLSENKEEIERILVGVDRVARIVSSLQLIKSSAELEAPQILSLETFMSEFLQMQHSSLMEKSISINVANIPKVNIKVRKTDLTKALNNIIENCMEALSQSPKKSIIIGFVVDPEFLKISFRDTGKGIPEKIRNRIMDPFFTTKEVGQGFGLGLSITKSIIESQGGKLVHIPSETGAIFQVYLPIENSNQGKKLA